jgi:hypothetical protein
MIKEDAGIMRRKDVERKGEKLKNAGGKQKVQEENSKKKKDCLSLCVIPVPLKCR